MDIYEFLPDGERYRMLFPVSDSAFDRIAEHADNRSSDWTPLELRWTGGDEPTDFPYFAPNVPVASARALDVISPMLGNVRVLPMKVPGGDYSALLVDDVVDALDREQSQGEWFDENSAMYFDVYAFHPEALDGHHLFRIPEYAASAVFASGTLIDACRDAGLRGLDGLAPVWRSGD